MSPIKQQEYSNTLSLASENKIQKLPQNIQQKLQSLNILRNQNQINKPLSKEFICKLRIKDIEEKNRIKKDLEEKLKEKKLKQKVDEIRKSTDSLESLKKLPMSQFLNQRQKEMGIKYQNSYKNVFPAYGVNYEGINSFYSHQSNHSQVSLASANRYLPLVDDSKSKSNLSKQRKVEKKVRKHFRTNYKDLLCNNIEEIILDTELKDQHYKKNIEQTLYRNSDQYMKDENYFKYFNDLVLKKKDHWQGLTAWK